MSITSSGIHPSVVGYLKSKSKEDSHLGRLAGYALFEPALFAYDEYIEDEDRALGSCWDIMLTCAHGSSPDIERFLDVALSSPNRAMASVAVRAIALMSPVDRQASKSALETLMMSPCFTVGTRGLNKMDVMGIYVELGMKSDQIFSKDIIQLAQANIVSLEYAVLVVSHTARDQRLFLKDLCEFYFSCNNGQRRSILDAMGQLESIPAEAWPMIQDGLKSKTTPFLGAALLCLALLEPSVTDLTRSEITKALQIIIEGNEERDQLLVSNAVRLSGQLSLHGLLVAIQELYKVKSGEYWDQVCISAISALIDYNNIVRMTKIRSVKDPDADPLTIDMFADIHEEVKKDGKPQGELCYLSKGLIKTIGILNK